LAKISPRRATNAAQHQRRLVFAQASVEDGFARHGGDEFDITCDLGRAIAPAACIDTDVPVLSPMAKGRPVAG
jgi:hypothetical protein